MPINRRRAASSEISREKKITGHAIERYYAFLIGGTTITGTQKSDVTDKKGHKHSVKSGKKWQVFLYSHDRISKSKHLNILLKSLEAFPEDWNQYEKDRISCISYKENYVKKFGRERAKLLQNSKLEAALGDNIYVNSKRKLSLASAQACETLQDSSFLEKFLSEALFNNSEVKYLAVKDSTYAKDGKFKVFQREEVVRILSANVFPGVSEAGHTPEDYNVGGQKTLLRYKRENGSLKNIVEIEIRNDSAIHFRQVRFNMYSKDCLYLLLSNISDLKPKKIGNEVYVYGLAKETF